MIAVELRQMLRRPRTWITIFVLCLLPAVVAIVLAVRDIEPSPDQPVLLAAVLTSGQLFPAAALVLVLPVFLPVAVALVGGESIAGEAQAGTLRYLLARPVGRTRLLIAKLISLLAFTILAVVAVVLSAYVIGTMLLGEGIGGLNPDATLSVTTFSGTPLTLMEVARRTLLALLYVTWSMMGIGAIALFFSTITDSPLTAALGALTVLILSGALDALNVAETLEKALPTYYWPFLVDFFREPIPWHDINRGIVVQGLYVVVALGLAWANFLTKDIKS